MRRFHDRTGIIWDVVLGRESWGASVALFVPPTASDLDVRQTPLQSSAYDAAIREIDNLDDAAIEALFDRSTPKQGGQ